mmetsp:Transcript_121201/g.387201  ORF Transcript_121201/g.387201 Transcript_121201/m.387201 type:complete len:123 (+) Transcript_121201:887-1255(+)
MTPGGTTPCGVTTEKQKSDVPAGVELFGSSSTPWSPPSMPQSQAAPSGSYDSSVAQSAAQEAHPSFFLKHLNPMRRQHFVLEQSSPSQEHSWSVAAGMNGRSVLAAGAACAVQVSNSGAGAG